MKKKYVSFGDILLPSDKTDMTKFACIACDQFTSDYAYWNKLGQFVGDSPSALGITYPEIFLNDSADERIRRITQNCRRYLDTGVFGETAYDAVIVDRSTPYCASRKGLVVKIDLDDYTTDLESPIRATEAVVAERVPPRMKIRENSPLELPHIMLLCDDPDGILVEAAYKSRGRKLYGFELNMGGGSISGYAPTDVKAIENAVAVLAEKSAEKYGREFVFAVGDGNHSLAAAKAMHEKHPENQQAKYALCEIVNVRSDGIIFHPIHRLCTVKDKRDFISYMQSKTRGLPAVSRLTSGGEYYTYNLPQDATDGVALVQRLIDEYGCEAVDYIHGEKELKEHALGENKVGAELFAPDKSQLFDTVNRRGKLPKKTFSIGEGVEKRYYLEARRLG